jgi:hypothetical protein
VNLSQDGEPNSHKKSRIPKLGPLSFSSYIGHANLYIFSPFLDQTSISRYVHQK